MKTKTIKITVDIREENCYGDKIDIQKEKEKILEKLKSIWNVAGIDMEGI